jgi:hypothetical protein
MDDPLMTSLIEAVARAWVLSKGDDPDEPVRWEPQEEGGLLVVEVAWESAARMYGLEAFAQALQSSGTYVVVPVEPEPEQVARAVWIASREEPTQGDKQLAATACMEMSGPLSIDREGDMVWAISEMLRDYRAMLKASQDEPPSGLKAIEE